MITQKDQTASRRLVKGLKLEKMWLFLRGGNGENVSSSLEEDLRGTTALAWVADPGAM